MPVTSPLAMIGTKRADFASSPATIAGCPASAARADRSRLTRTGAFVSTTCRLKPISCIGSAGSRSPRSTVYMKLMIPVLRS